MAPLPKAKWELFAQGIAAGRNATEAYLAAGYKTNAKAGSVSASRLLENPNVKARLAEIHNERAHIHAQGVADAISAVALTKQWVLEKLMENVARAMQDKAVTGPEGEPIGEYTYNGGVANRSLELLGKELGMFIDRKEIGQPGDFDRLTDEELRQHVERESQELLGKRLN